MEFVFGTINTKTFKDHEFHSHKEGETRNTCSNHVIGCLFAELFRRNPLPEKEGREHIDLPRVGK